MMRNPISLLLIAVIFPIMVARTSWVPQAPAPNNTWSQFVDISNTSTASTYPSIAADTEGNVHVVWSEDVGGKTRNIQFGTNGSPMLDTRGNQINALTDTGNTLFYTRWNGVKWLDPVDIVINPNGHVQYPQVAVDAHGVIHLVWIATEGRQATLYYSQAIVGKAESAQAWQKPIVLAESVLFAYYPADIVTDPSGGIHVLYTQIGAEPGVYIANSFDGGNTWSSPIELYRTNDPEGAQEGVSPTKLAIDSNGRLYATWSRFGADGNGKGIYFSQSRDSGRTWSKPFQAAAWQAGWYEVDWLSAGVVGDVIHLVWEGSSSVAAIYERISYDGGLTWGEPHQILSTLVGENGFADFVVDSANQLHMQVVKRGDAGAIAHGVWSTVWETDHWQDPTLLGTSYNNLYSQLDQISQTALQDMLRGSFTGNGLRYQRSVIVNGNELFVVVVNEWDGDIWGSHITLNTPYINPQPYPKQEATPTRLTVITPQPTPTATSLPAVSSSGATTSRGTDVGEPVLVGSLFVLFLMVGAVIGVGVIRRMRN